MRFYLMHYRAMQETPVKHETQPEAYRHRSCSSFLVLTTIRLRVNDVNLAYHIDSLIDSDVLTSALVPTTTVL